MSNSVNGGGGLKGVQLDAYSSSTPKSDEPSGQLGRWSVAVVPGKAILQGKQQLARSTQTALLQRNVAVVKNYNTHLLKRGAGGVEKNSQQAKELKQDVTQLAKQEAKYVTASRNFEEAARNLEALRNEVGWDTPATRKNGLIAAEKKLETAESKLQKEGQTLISAQDNLAVSIGLADDNKSVLDGLFTPSKPGLFHKDDKAVLEARLESIQTLETSLHASLSSSLIESRQGDTAASLEVRRLTQQLQELSASKVAIGERLQSDKGFHSSGAPTTPESNQAKRNLTRVQNSLNHKLEELRGARKHLDMLILNGVPSNSSERQGVEEKLRVAEKNVSQLAEGLKEAESNYSAALKNDRKHDKANRKSEDKFRALLNAAQNKLPARKHKAAHQAQQQPVAPPSRPRPAPKAAGVQPPVAPPRQKQAQTLTGVAAQQPQPRKARTSAGDLTNAAKQMKTLDDVRQFKERLVKHTGMTNTERLMIGSAMNRRIAEMMKDKDLASQASMAFIETYVQGREAQARVNLIRINTSAGN